MPKTNESLVQELIASGALKTPELIAAFRAVDRADFVRPEYRSEAYENYPLPIGEGQTISQPYTVAFMLELLQPKRGETILDVGHGSGWQTALLAAIVGETGKITAYERIPELSTFGKENIEKYHCIARGVVRCMGGDATELPQEIIFDKIIAAASANKKIPESWKHTLKVGGTIVAPVGESVWRFTKLGETGWKEEEFPGFAFVPLLASPITERNEGAVARPLQQTWRTYITRDHPLFPILLFFLIVMPLGFLSYALFVPKTLLPQKIEVVVPEGAGVRAIGATLEKEGIVRSQWLFLFWAVLSGHNRELREGAYTFVGRADIPHVVSVLSGGERYPNERALIIPEGWNLADIANYLAAENIASLGAWYAVTGRPREALPDSETTRRLKKEFPFLSERPAGHSLEGYLFPDTYRIYRDAAAEDIVKKMLQNFDKKITPELHREINRRGKTIDEIVTMASLIEKEVVSDEDRALISGILWKRLELGIGLQVDATVAYITGKRTTRLTKDDLAVDSPYNTYRYRGLPPGPIANPGLAAIRTAVFPKESPYFYYLSAPDGRTIFSKTLEEHNTAKAKYLR